MWLVSGAEPDEMRSHPPQTHIPNNIAINVRQWDKAAVKRDSQYPIYDGEIGYTYDEDDFIKSYEMLMNAGICYFDGPTLGTQDTFGSVINAAK